MAIMLAAGGMVDRYVQALEEQQICSKTNAIWTINDVPKLWRASVISRVIADGYVFDDEGHAVKPMIKGSED